MLVECRGVILTKRYPRSCEVPDVADPRWEKWSAPLREYLYKYRCWEELSVWRKEQGIQETILIQLLAWLSVNKLAGCTNGEWIAYIDPLKTVVLPKSDIEIAVTSPVVPRGQPHESAT